VRTDSSDEQGEPEAGAPRFTYDEYFATGAPRRLGRLPGLLRASLGIVWRSARRQLVLSVAMQAVGAATIAAQLLVIRDLLGELLAGGATIGSLAPELAAMAVLAAVSSVASVVLESQYRILGQLVSLHTADQVIETATAVDLVAYESPAFHDRLQRAQASAGSRPTQLANGLVGVLGSTLSVVGVGIALAVVQPLFCALLLLAYVPAWLAAQRAGRLAYQLSVRQTERERRRWYLFGLLTRKQEAQEVRAFDLAGYLGGVHRRLGEAMIEETREMIARRLRLAVAGQLATALLGAATVALLAWFVTSGRVSLAGGGAAAGAMVLLTGRLRGLASNLGGLYEGSLFLDDYTSFVDAAPRVAAGRPARGLPSSLGELAVHEVTFRYPSRSADAVAGVSLTLRPGTVVALVGENGSGKTTLAKLLAGLYQPGSGTITWDGIDLATVDPAA
jgi:ATP-binding cassette subfamily B protein